MHQVGPKITVDFVERQNSVKRVSISLKWMTSMSLGQILQIGTNFDLVMSLPIGGMTHLVKQMVALQQSSKLWASELVANEKFRNCWEGQTEHQCKFFSKNSVIPSSSSTSSNQVLQNWLNYKFSKQSTHVRRYCDDYIFVKYIYVVEVKIC